ncbi:MAG: PEP-CTERM sorting domain-containing protein [Deltaproteobacteria bacterium]|nr:MAG: PEP-CTERM sorting domain-containing protein [Deltaproteobacteria bacterium]
MGRCTRTYLWMVAWCLLLEGLWGSIAHAGPILTFADPQTFFSAVQVVTTETFDEFRSNTNIGVGSVTLDGITYTSSNPSAIWFVSDTFVTPSPPNSLVTSNAIAPVTLTFEGEGFTDAIGFFLVGVGGIPSASYRVDVVAVDGERLDQMISPGVITTNIFRGFAAEGGILSLTISPVEVGGSIANFHLDSVSHGAISTNVVPEPSTLSMAGAGVLISLGYAWRRRCRLSPEAPSA